MLRLPFMILRVIPHTGGILRGEAATDSGARARSSGEELSPADDQAMVAAALAALKSRDGGFDLAATTRGVVRAREAVDRARQAGDASAARQVMSDGLWRVFVLLLAERAAHGVRRQGTSVVVGAEVVAATHDRLAEQLRIRLACQGERCEVTGVVLRGQYGQHRWDEDWIIRRSADAMTPANGGVLSGRCPQCGAALRVEADGSCAYCRALVLAGGRDWVVWSIEEAPW
jgi:transposase